MDNLVIYVFFGGYVLLSLYTMYLWASLSLHKLWREPKAMVKDESIAIETPAVQAKCC